LLTDGIIPAAEHGAHDGERTVRLTSGPGQPVD
jgi:hypothetical protein